MHQEKEGETKGFRGNDERGQISRYEFCSCQKKEKTPKQKVGKYNIFYVVGAITSNVSTFWGGKARRGTTHLVIEF